VEVMNENTERTNEVVPEGLAGVLIIDAVLVQVKILIISLGIPG